MLEFNTVEILSMGASISTMIGLIIAIISLWNYYREKREKQEYDVKKYFFDGMKWKCIQETANVVSNSTHHFELHITNANFHSFAGEIKTLNPDSTEFRNVEKMTMFHFKEIKRDKININIFQATESSKGNISIKELGTANLIYINPQMFKITLNESNLSKFPHTAYLVSM